MAGGAIGSSELFSSQVKPDQPPAGASPAYRALLAAALFYKSYLSALPSIDPRWVAESAVWPCILPNLKILLRPPSLQSAATPYVRPASTGQQTYTVDPSLAPVGQAIPKPASYLAVRL